MSSRELAELAETTTVNISRIKNGAIKGVRFSTLYELCTVLNCQPGDLFAYVPDDEYDPDKNYDDYGKNEI